MAVRVVTDSASYIPPALRCERDIVEVPLYLREGGSMLPETGIDLPAFYERLAASRVLPTTSQPSPDDFVRVFERAVEDGRDVLGVFISGGMSGTVASAETAAGIVRESSPDARITVVDSRANCMQEGFAVLAAADAARAGGSLEECERATRESMRRSRFLFAPRSLDNLRRGGRISAAGALLGSALGIVPVLTAEDGTTGVAAKVRTFGKALRRIGELMRADVERSGLARVVVQGIVDMELAAEFSRAFIEPIAGSPVEVVPVGPVVGVHVGPAVGVAYETIEPLR